MVNEWGESPATDDGLCGPCGCKGGSRQNGRRRTRKQSASYASPEPAASCGSLANPLHCTLNCLQHPSATASHDNSHRTPGFDSVHADFMRASLTHDSVEAERLLGASLPTDWPDCPRLLEMRLKQLEDDPSLQKWLLRAMVLRSDRVTVGHIGFHEAPGPEHLSRNRARGR